MKNRTDGYDDCLKLWETVWCLHFKMVLKREAESVDKTKRRLSRQNSQKIDFLLKDESEMSSKLSSESNSPVNSYNNNVPKLDDVELFTLCLCLSIIRGERDLIMSNRYDACEILKVSG